MSQSKGNQTYIPWKGMEILVVKMPDGENAPEHYRVFGRVNGTGSYDATPILNKDQRSCRAYLRGYNPAKKWEKIPPHAKISFLENI